jgi:hypothetical protein
MRRMGHAEDLRAASAVQALCCDAEVALYAACGAPTRLAECGLHEDIFRVRFEPGTTRGNTLVSYRLLWKKQIPKR